MCQEINVTRMCTCQVLKFPHTPSLDFSWLLLFKKLNPECLNRRFD